MLRSHKYRVLQVEQINVAFLNKDDKVYRVDKKKDYLFIAVVVLDQHYLSKNVFCNHVSYDGKKIVRRLHFGAE